MGEMKISAQDLWLLPLMGPYRLLVVVLEAIKEAAGEEMAFDEPSVTRKLVELQEARQMGRIEEEQFRRLWREAIGDRSTDEGVPDQWR